MRVHLVPVELGREVELGEVRVRVRAFRVRVRVRA